MESGTSQLPDEDIHKADADAELAYQGIHLMLNNKTKESLELFNKYSKNSIQMCAGKSFVTFMQALMTFEDDKLQESMQSLKNTEKRCAEEISTLKAMKPKLEPVTDKRHTSWILQKRLERQIIIADCMCCMALLTFISQEWTCYVKGGWILRKAWKVYDRTYSEIRWLYAQKCPNEIDSPMSESTTSNLDVELCVEDLEIDENVLTDDDRSCEENQTLKSLLPPPPLNRPQQVFLVDSDVLDIIPENIVSRLMAAISFGYGIFQLSISLLPPSLLKIIHFLGFDGDRRIGLKALAFARKSTDMRSPIALLGLLWYHTVIRPFFALDGRNIRAGVQEAQLLLEDVQKEFSGSSLFLFFRGLVHRLNNQLPAALVLYKQALNSSDQREVQLVCYHEIGWCYLLEMDWEESMKSFIKVREESRWSKCFYAYIAAVCVGAQSDPNLAKKAMKEVPSLVRRKTNQLEMFVCRRACRIMKESKISIDGFNLYALEVVFLWNAISSCSDEVLKKILRVCDSISDKKLLSLKCLIEGASYNQLGDRIMAKQCYEESIARSSGSKEDLHIPAFASYELGVMLSSEQSDLSQAENYLIKAKNNFKGCDFENRLNVKVHAALKIIKNS